MQWLLDRFATAPDKEAFIHEGERSTYSEVLARIEGFEAILGRPGIGAGDKVAILADFAPGVICLMLAAPRRSVSGRSPPSIRWWRDWPPRGGPA